MAAAGAVLALAELALVDLRSVAAADGTALELAALELAALVVVALEPLLEELLVALVDLRSSESIVAVFFLSCRFVLNSPRIGRNGGFLSFFW